MKIITSRTNETVKKILKLHAKKGRDQYGLFIAEGIRTIETLLRSSLSLHQLYTTEHISSIECSDELITYITPEVMEKISCTHNSSGYLALFVIPKNNVTHLQYGIVLANISDPGNMGTLIRTATALALPSIVVIDGCDPWSPKVVQATAGTIGSAQIIQTTWESFTKAAQNKTICALVVKDGNHPRTLPSRDYFLVIGNEAHGIPDNWLAQCSCSITIPMPGNTESLNASVAGSIAMYLATDQS